MGMGAERQQALWHGFADMGAVATNGEFVITRGDGAEIWDSAGRRYLDATAGLWFTNVGHGRREIAHAVAQQIGKIAAYSTFGDYAVDTTVALADRLAAIAPVPGSKIFFTSGGSDSVDTAVKLARRYWRETGQPTKNIVIGREKAYHGMHVAGTALAGIPGQPRRLRRTDDRRADHRLEFRQGPAGGGRDGSVLRTSPRSSANRSSAPAASIPRRPATWPRSGKSAGTTTSCSSPTR